MADKTHIEWTRGADGSPGATWNPITGCSLVSEGCRHCYAARLAATRLKGHPSRAGLARLNAAGEAKFTGEVRFVEQWLDQPLRWRRPRRIFVCAHGDLFHENVPDEWIDRVFAVMALSPQHTFQCLSKRPERMRSYLSDAATVDRIAALVYFARHGQRDNTPDERAIPGGPGRDDLADREAARSRRDARRGLLSGCDHLALHAGSSGVSNEGRLLAGLRYDQPGEDRDIGAQAVVGGGERPDPGGHDDQPQGWREDEQSTGELGVGDDERAAPSRAGCSFGGAPSPYRLETPEDDASGSGRSGNPAEASERRARDRHSRGVSHETKGNQRNLHGQDLGAHLVWPLHNVWLGTSVEDQATADQRIPHLLATPAAVRFISAEPLLGPVRLDHITTLRPDDHIDALAGRNHFRFGPDDDMEMDECPRLDWVIVGGESGPGARPMHPGWARSLRDQCAAAGVAFFFKQWGEWVPVPDDPHDSFSAHRARGGRDYHAWPDGEAVELLSKSRAGRLLDGREHNGMPEGGGDGAL